MKRLILSLALSALLLSTAYAMAGGGGTTLELQRAWNAQQAQQETLARQFDKIERDAAKALRGIFR